MRVLLFGLQSAQSHAVFEARVDVGRLQYNLLRLLLTFVPFFAIAPCLPAHLLDLH